MCNVQDRVISSEFVLTHASPSLQMVLVNVYLTSYRLETRVFGAADFRAASASALSLPQNVQLHLAIPDPLVLVTEFHL